MQAGMHAGIPRAVRTSRRRPGASSIISLGVFAFDDDDNDDVVSVGVHIL